MSSPSDYWVTDVTRKYMQLTARSTRREPHFTPTGKMVEAIIKHACRNAVGGKADFPISFPSHSEVQWQLFNYYACKYGAIYGVSVDLYSTHETPLCLRLHHLSDLIKFPRSDKYNCFTQGYFKVTDVLTVASLVNCANNAIELNRIKHLLAPDELLEFVCLT